MGKNIASQTSFHLQNLKVKRMNPRVVLHLTVYLIFWNEASQESVVPTKFLGAFIEAGDRHSTVVIRDWNSGE